jgi:hypothetical protein
VARYFDDGEETSLSKGTVEKRILDAVDVNSKVTIKDRTLFRYILFRAPQSGDVLKVILKAWEHHPEHTDAYVAFLENYQRCDGVVTLAVRLLESKYPYDYVQGELWKLVARMGNKVELSRLTQLAIETVRNSSSGHASKLGAYIFLCRCDKEGLGNYEKWMMYEKMTLVQALATPYMRFDSSSGIATGKMILSRSLVDGYLGMVKPLIDANLDLNSFGKNPVEFPIVAQQVFGNAGLTGHLLPRPDAIGNMLSKRYAVKKWNKWKDLLQAEYEHAHMELRFAGLYFESHLSTWLNYQAAFNEILFRSFQDFLAKKSAFGAITLVNRKGERLDWGVLLENSIFKSAYPDLQDDLNKVHKRRNSVPGSHPYDKKTGDKARPLKKKEQAALKLYLDDAFIRIIQITESLGI